MRIQWEYTFKCPECHVRSSRSTINYKCIYCDGDIKKAARQANSIISLLLSGGLLVVLFMYLIILTYSHG